MALSDEQIKSLTEKHLRIVGAGYVRPQDTTSFARAIESEVRKDDEALIRQLRDALEIGRKLVAMGGVFTVDELKVMRLGLEAANARLLDSDLSTLTERGAKAWAGVDPQKLREGGAL